MDRIRYPTQERNLIKKELKKLSDAKMSAEERAVRLLESAQLTFDLLKFAVLHFNKPDMLSEYADFRDIRGWSLLLSGKASFVSSS